MNNHYSGLPSQCFWKSGVVHSTDKDLRETIYCPKWEITPNHKIVTAGSCFAQHISRSLRKKGCSFLDYEKAPPGLPLEERYKFGYDMFSARYGNIYTVRQLKHLIEEAHSARKLFSEQICWKLIDAPERIVDPLRPMIEPYGFASKEEMLQSRILHLNRLNSLLRDMDVFIFTLGLIEFWEHLDFGTALPIAPGINSYDTQGHSLYVPHSMSYSEVLEDIYAVIKLIEAVRPLGSGQCKFLFTVSPVPLTATALSRHVLISNTESKSILRTAASQVAREFDFCDYFPSFEIMSNPACVSDNYEDNLRSVTPRGVSRAMATFLHSHRLGKKMNAQKMAGASLFERMPGEKRIDHLKQLEDVQCEESLLEASRVE